MSPIPANVGDLLMACVAGWQHGARHRTLDTLTPLLYALNAALGRDMPATVVWKSGAKISVAAAERVGNRVIVSFGRIRHPGNRARSAVELSRLQRVTSMIIPTSQLLGRLPALPAGWRWVPGETGPVAQPSTALIVQMIMTGRASGRSSRGHDGPTRVRGTAGRGQTQGATAGNGAGAQQCRT